MNKFYLSAPVSIAASLLALFAAFLGYRIMTTPEPGWCREKNMKIQDDDFIRVVNKAIFKHLEGYVTMVYPDGRRELMKRKDGYTHWEFSPDHPLCCSVRRKNRPIILEAIIGPGDVTVEVSPRIVDPFPLGSDHNFRFWFTACGTLLDSDIGLPNTEQPLIEVN